MKDSLSTSIEYYQDLLLYQYADKPKARDTIGLLASAGLCDLVEMSMNAAFNVNTSVGKQLDIIGEYAGQPRLYIGQLDDEYRSVLKLVIVKNYSNTTMYSINNLLYGFFGNSIIAFDQANMTMSYWVSETLGAIASLSITHDLLPRPMGVAISGVFTVTDTAAVFAFQDYTHDNGYTTGFSDYTTGFVDIFMNYTFQL